MISSITTLLPSATSSSRKRTRSESPSLGSNSDSEREVENSIIVALPNGFSPLTPGHYRAQDARDARRRKTARVESRSYDKGVDVEEGDSESTWRAKGADPSTKGSHICLDSRGWMGLRAGRRTRSHLFGEWRVWWWMWARTLALVCRVERCVGRSTKDPRARLRSRGWQWVVWGRPKPSCSLGELRVQFTSPYVYVRKTRLYTQDLPKNSVAVTVLLSTV